MEEYVRIIEAAIESFGIDPVANRDKRPGTWLLKRGSAQVIVLINRVNNYLGERDIVVMISKICDLPPNASDSFLKKLLIENHKFVGEKFSIFNNELCITSNRDLAGLSSKEIRDMLDSLSWCADTFDDIILKELGLA